MGIYAPRPEKQTSMSRLHRLVSLDMTSGVSLSDLQDHECIRHSTQRTTQPLKPGRLSMGSEPSKASINTCRDGRIARVAGQVCELPRMPCISWRLSLDQVRGPRVPHWYLKVERLIPAPIRPSKWPLALLVATYPSRWNQPLSCAALGVHRRCDDMLAFRGDYYEFKETK